MAMLGQEDAHTLVESAGPHASQVTPAMWSRYADSPYLLGERIAAGGMGTVHLALKQGALGFRRLLAIKRLHVHLAGDPDFVARFKDEIRLVSRLNHPNVVQTLDVVESADELALVMEYVDGVTLHQMMKDASAADIKLPIALAVGVITQVLHGLHSAHELLDDGGRLLQLVHRDVSPQNIMIARDGLVKVLDFGVAKATIETHITRTGQLSGKAPYMSPEQVWGLAVDRRTDVFAAGVVLWEALTGQRLFRPPGTPEGSALRNVLEMRVKSPTELRPEVSPALERIVLRALDREPSRRFGSARDFALALEEAVPEASVSTVVNGVMAICGQRLADGSLVARAMRADLGEAALSKSAPSSAAGSDQRAAVGRLGLAASGGAPSRASAELTTLPGELKPLDAELQTSDVQGVPLEETRRPRFGGRPLLVATLAAGMLTLLGIHFFGGSADVQGLAAEGMQSAKQMNDIRPAVAAGVSASTDSPRQSVGPLHKPSGRPSVQDAPAPDERQAASTALSPESLPLAATPVATARPSAPVLRTQARPPAAAKPATVAARSATKPTQKPKLEQVGAPDALPSGRAVVPSPKPNCSPPTYTDSEGIRHFKPECL